MLLSREEVVDSLRCPRTGVPLKRIDQSLVSDDSHKRTYRIVNGFPIMIDQEHSVVDSDTALSSPIQRHRYGGLKRFLKRLVSPPKAATARNVAELMRLIKQDDPRPCVLVVGGASVGQGVKPLYDDPDVRVIAFDIFSSEFVQFVADGHSIPLPDNFCNAILIQAVLEHVLEPQQVVAEIWRVLDDKGIVYAETPFLQQVHEGPYDFTRFTESGHRYLFRDFEEIRTGATAGLGTQMVWSIDYFVRSVCRSRMAGKLAKVAFFWMRWFDRIIPEEYAIDGASGLFFMGRKSETPIDGREAVERYKGAQK